MSEFLKSLSLLISLFYYDFLTTGTDYPVIEH